MSGPGLRGIGPSPEQTAWWETHRERRRSHGSAVALAYAAAGGVVAWWTGQFWWLLLGGGLAAGDRAARQLERIEDDLDEVREQLMYHTWNDPREALPKDWMERYLSARDRERRLSVWGRLKHAFGGDDAYRPA